MARKRENHMAFYTFSFLAWERDFSPLEGIQTISEAQTASCSLGAMGYTPPPPTGVSVQEI
jgi:hypothetical protein